MHDKRYALYVSQHGFHVKVVHSNDRNALLEEACHWFQHGMTCVLDDLETLEIRELAEKDFFRFLRDN